MLAASSPGTYRAHLFAAVVQSRPRSDVNSIIGPDLSGPAFPEAETLADILVGGMQTRLIRPMIGHENGRAERERESSTDRVSV